MDLLLSFLEENANVSDGDLHFENLLSNTWDKEVSKDVSDKLLLSLEPNLHFSNPMNTSTSSTLLPTPPDSELPSDFSDASEEEDRDNNGFFLKNDDDIDSILSLYNNSGSLEDASMPTTTTVAGRRHTTRRSSPAVLSMSPSVEIQSKLQPKSVLLGDEEFQKENQRPLCQTENNLPTLTPLEDTSIFDLPDSPSVIIFSSRPPKEGQMKKILAATLEKLVEHLTSQIDYPFLNDFFLVYRSFTSSVELCKLLILRFKWALQEDSERRQIVRMRTFLSLRHWLTQYYPLDFSNSQALRCIMNSFIMFLSTHPAVLKSSRDTLMAQALSKEFTLQKRKWLGFGEGNADDNVSILSKKHRSFPSGRSYHARSTSLTTLYKQKENAPSTAISKESSKDVLSDSDSHKRSIFKYSNTGKSSLSTRLSQKISQLKSRVPVIYETVARSFGGSENLEHVPKLFMEEETPEGYAAATVLQNQPFPWLLQQKSEVIAQQFCLIEQEMFKSIKWTELLDLGWKRKKKEQKKLFLNIPSSSARSSQDFDVNSESDQSFLLEEKRQSSASTFSNISIDSQKEDSVEEESGILNLIDRFNVACQWVAYEVVRHVCLDTRVKVIEKFTRIAKKCYQYKNYSTMMQIVLGLQSSHVERLKKTWSRVGSAEMSILKELSNIASPVKNFSLLRREIYGVIDSTGCNDVHVLDWFEKELEYLSKESLETELFTDQGKRISADSIVSVESIPTNPREVGGAVPFLGIFLSDLVFNAETPSMVRPEDPLGEYEEKPKMINFQKYRIMASIIKRFLILQQYFEYEGMQEDLGLYPKCLFLRTVDGVVLKNISQKCEN